jgi:hypothetical protein
MSVDLLVLLPLKGGVYTAPSSKAAWSERTEDKGDQGAVSFVDIGVRVTWANKVVHRGGGEPAVPRTGVTTCLAGATPTAATGVGLSRTREQLRAAKRQHTWRWRRRNRRWRARIRRPLASGRPGLVVDCSEATQKRRQK